MTLTDEQGTITLDARAAGIADASTQLTIPLTDMEMPPVEAAPEISEDTMKKLQQMGIFARGKAASEQIWSMQGRGVFADMASATSKAGSPAGAGSFSAGDRVAANVYGVASPRIQSKWADAGVAVWEKCFLAENPPTSEHIEKAAAAYLKQQGTDKIEDGKAFRQFIEATPEHAAALADIRLVQVVFQGIDALGLNRREEREAKSYILRDRMFVDGLPKGMPDWGVAVDLIDSGTPAATAEQAASN